MNSAVKTIFNRFRSFCIIAAQRIIFSNRINFISIWPKIDRVEGLLVKGQEEWLFKTAQSLPEGAIILEIGGYKGRSSVCLGYGCLKTRRRVFTIDTFKGVYQDVLDRENLRNVFETGFFHEWKTNIKANGLLEYVIPFVGNSHEVARFWGAQIHMLFIDGSHKFEDVMADFSNFYPFVVPEGIIALHDVTPKWQGCYKAWHECIKHQLKDIGQVSSLAYGKK